MYKIYKREDKIEGSSIIEIRGNEGSSYAKLNLKNGGILQELKLNSKEVIKDLKPLAYKDTFASSILFPFASRIKNGEYTFLNKRYSLPLNDGSKEHALHGLVYNKTFNIVEQFTNKTTAQVTLEYKQEELLEGFPFKFSLQLIYKLTDNVLTLKIRVLNQGKESLPCSIGWHPYFCSSDLYESKLSFNSSKKITFDNDLIVKGEVEYTNNEEVKIKDTQFDDCFVLNESKVQFQTPDYTINIDSSSDYNYLVVYTINEMNVIAIEPLTAPPNCFNTKKSLKVLEPNGEYNETFKIELIKDQA